MASLLDKKTFRFRIIRESGLIALIILGTFFATAQIKKHIEQVNGAIIAENSLYGMRQFQKDSFDALNEHLRSIQMLRDQITRALPPTEDIREFQKILDTFAQKRGVLATVAVGGVTPSTIKLGNITLQTITISIDITGETNAIRGYISEVEHLPYFFTITNFDEKRDPTKPASRHTILTGTLWTKPEQTLTQREQQ